MLLIERHKFKSWRAAEPLGETRANATATASTTPLASFVGAPRSAGYLRPDNALRPKGPSGSRFSTASKPASRERFARRESPQGLRTSAIRHRKQDSGSAVGRLVSLVPIDRENIA